MNKGANGDPRMQEILNHTGTNKQQINSITLNNGINVVSPGTSDKAPNTVFGSDNKTGQGIANASNTTSQPYFDFNGGSGTVNSMDMYHPKTLVDAVVTEETIELKYIRRAKFSYTQTNFTIYPPYSSYTPDIAIKEIYGCRDGKLTLLKTVNGRVQPPQDIPETLVFDDEISE